MFDCVLPTRNARNGQLFTSAGRLNIKNAAFATDDRPIDEDCQCYTCRTHSRAYLRHLFVAREMTAGTLNSLHNLHFYLDTMIVSAAVGYLTIKYFLQYLASHSLTVFAWYRLALAACVAIWWLHGGA